MMRHARVLIAVAGILFLVRIPAACDVRYTVTDLGTLGGSLSSALCINDLDQIVGRSYTSTGASRAFLWENGRMALLPTLYGHSTAYAVNDQGQIVGISYLSTGRWHACRWDNGSVTDLGVLPGAPSNAVSYAYGINDSGQVVGESTNYYGRWSATIWSGSGPVELPNSSDGPDACAHGINNLGQVAGAYFRSGMWHAAMWDDLGHMIDLELPEQSIAYAISDTGSVVGEYMVSSRPFLWKDGVLTDLGVPGYDSTARSVNRAGAVVGDGYTLTMDLHAWAWQNGVGVDLNQVISADSGWVLQTASSINDSGKIVGTGIRNGQSRAYLLTPVPEPSSLLVLLCGVGSIGGWTWWRRG